MKIDIKHLVKLANLNLNKDEEEKFGKQLSSILEYINKLNEIDTTNIEPTSQVTGLENITREDTTIPSLSQEEVLSNAKPARNASRRDAGGSKHNGFFKVKAILDE